MDGHVIVTGRRGAYRVHCLLVFQLGRLVATQDLLPHDIAPEIHYVPEIDVVPEIDILSEIRAHGFLGAYRVHGLLVFQLEGLVATQKNVSPPSHPVYLSSGGPMH